MPEPVKMKCLRCGYEYTAPASGKSEPEERTCPKCRSNSVRIMRAENSAPE